MMISNLKKNTFVSPSFIQKYFSAAGVKQHVRGAFSLLRGFVELEKIQKSEKISEMGVFCVVFVVVVHVSKNG